MFLGRACILGRAYIHVLRQGLYLRLRKVRILPEWRILTDFGKAQTLSQAGANPSSERRVSLSTQVLAHRPFSEKQPSLCRLDPSQKGSPRYVD